MNIRRIVKKLIPTRLFRGIEPLGHLIEAIIANIRFGFPARKMRFIGVTGTNGKTTTSFYIYNVLKQAGVKVGLSTTVAYGVGNDITRQKEHITTAQAGVLQRRLREFANKGVEWVVLETSSHALAQHRVWGIPYEIAVFTNLTHDHLDYHGTFQRYKEAKRALFKIANKHGFKYGVVNADDPNAEAFTNSVENFTTYGIKSGDLRAKNVQLKSEGSSFEAALRVNGTKEPEIYKIKTQIPGEFNVYNSLAAILVGQKIGLSKQHIEKGIATLSGVDGRMNRIDAGQDFQVIVDFASTPDGFEKLFQSIRPLVKGKLVAVFGSAGRRDASKRRIQGEIAGKYADYVIATEEDDRDEDGSAILAEIIAGATSKGKVEGKTVWGILDREEAIGRAMTLVSSKNDAVVLLGKGHEQTIERADGVYPWNEAEAARAAIKAIKKF